MLYLVHVLAASVTAILSLVVARWVRRQTRDRSGVAMIAVLIGNAAIAALGVAQLLSPSLELKLLWNTLWFAIVLMIPVGWLLLAIYYTGRESWLTKSVWGLLLALVIVPGGLMLTNPFHELLLTDYRMASEPFGHMAVTETLRFGPVLALTHVNVVLSVALFLRMFIFSRRSTRWQIAAVLVGMVATFVPVVAAAAGRTPVGTYPYGVFGSSVFAVVVAVALFRTRMFAVAPLARDALFDSLDEAIVVVDARLIVVDFNDTAAALFPALEEHVGERIDESYPAFLDSDQSRADPDGDSGAAVSDGGWTFDRPPFVRSFRHSADGDSRTLRVSVSGITSGGEPRGYGLVVRDVTELERRTDQLERFASVLSHDLRNPVSVAAGYAELALETGDLDHVHEVQTSLERIDETIEDLLTLSRDGETIDDVETISLRSTAEDAWTTTDTKTAALEIDLDDALVRADRSRLQTLFENLFRNAADHGGETVRVGSLGRGFFVADDGPGIPPEERETVFEHGFTSSDDGTGLGLAIVDRIADAHGWSVSVTESESGGARFEVTGVEAP